MPQSTVKIIKQLILFVYIQIQIQIFKMDQFRIQLVKQSPPVPAPTQIKVVPKLNVSITSITCLNYPIETLTEVLAAHFEEEPCPANLVFKALKIISISLKDKQLRQGLERILMTNLHKREKVYNLFVLWTNTIGNLIPILTKIDMKLIQNLLGVVFAYYCFTNTPYNSNISQLLNNLTAQLPSESVNKINQYTKNQFMAMDYPIDIFLNCTNKFKNMKESESLSQFLSSLSTSICKFQQSDNKFRAIVSLYLIDQLVKTRIDQFFIYFPQLTQFFINSFSLCINKAQAIQIWFNSTNYRLEQLIRTAVKQWISNKHRLWETIDSNFNKLREEKEVKKLQKLLELGSETDSATFTNFIIKKYLYNFFIGLSFQPDLDSKLVSLISEDKQILKRIHSALQTMNDVIKSFKNVHRSGNVNMLIINKLLAPEEWDTMNFQALSSLKNNKNKQNIEKISEIYRSLEKVMIEKGKKIQLAFHVIKIQYLTETGAKQDFYITVRQLSDILKYGTQNKNITFLDEYKALATQQKKTEKKDIQIIVIEAKIVRILKKSKTKLLFKEIYEQVIKQLDILQESFRLAMEKVVSKGFAESEEGGIYVYSP